MRCYKNQLWVEQLTNLVCSYSLIPMKGMSFAEQMNSITRFVLVIFIFLLLFSFKFALLFLFLTMIVIVTVYYLNRDNVKEQYTEMKQTPEIQKLEQKGAKILYQLPESVYRFCNDTVNIEPTFNNENYLSINQQLVGKANPKTLIPPVVVPPPMDLENWRGSNLSVMYGINEESNIDVYRSGYQVSTCCGDVSGKVMIPQQEPTAQYIPVAQRRKETPIKYGTLIEDETPIREGFDIKPNMSGWVNTSCGYNPQQLFEAGLPTNLPVGNCARNPRMKEFNEDLFTQTVQPGVYTRTDINEPINSNIGISFNQQFPPTSCLADIQNEEIYYTEHDPRIYNPPPCAPQPQGITEANVYDPRFSGYGTSYRSYIEDVTGQPRFFYDDVNAIRMPNYIVRSKIDHQPFADQYGPIKQGDEFGNKFTPDIHALANNAFLDGSLQFRTGLQERLMRKINAEAWQQRMAPIHTNYK